MATKANPADFSIETYGVNGSQVEIRISQDGQRSLVGQDAIARLYGIDASGVSRHIKNIFDEGELPVEGNLQKLQLTSDGRPTNFYSLDVAISVGYRVNSAKATSFRRWSNEITKSYIERGFALDPERMDSDPDAVRALERTIRQIRTSEQGMYEKVREVFKVSASDYDKNSRAAKSFFAVAQDKFHHAITGKTAAQLLIERSDATKPSLGMQTVIGTGVPSFEDARVAKNYLTDDELHGLENICEQWLLFTESKAFRGQKMSMEELSFKLNTLLTANDYPVLYDYPDVSRPQADAHVRQQIAKYKTLHAPKRAKAIDAGSQ